MGLQSPDNRGFVWKSVKAGGGKRRIYQKRGGWRRVGVVSAHDEEELKRALGIRFGARPAWLVWLDRGITRLFGRTAACLP
jgi:muconolactone delta-isomerase